MFSHEEIGKSSSQSGGMTNRKSADRCAGRYANLCAEIVQSGSIFGLHEMDLKFHTPMTNRQTNRVITSER